MSFLVWLIPIIIITVLLAILSDNQKPWEELSEKEKNQRKTLIIMGFIMLIIGIFLFILLK